MHALHKMTRDKVLPFEWIAGRNPLLAGMGNGKRHLPGGAGGAKRSPHGTLFEQQRKYKWWSGLRED